MIENNFYTREYLENQCNLNYLKYIVMEMGGRPSTRNKQQLIDLILDLQSGKPQPNVSKRGRPSNMSKGAPRPTFGKGFVTEVHDHSLEKEQYLVQGVYQINLDGNGYLRTVNYSISKKDVLVGYLLSHRYGLREGDFVVGYRNTSTSAKVLELGEIVSVNGQTEIMEKRPDFESISAVYPKKIINIDTSADKMLKVLQLFTPIGRGQRVIVSCSQGSAKAVFLKKLCWAMQTNNEDLHLMVLPMFERPEEIQDYLEYAPHAEVIGSTFDKDDAYQAQIALLAFERAKRLVECGKNVVLVIDDIVTLATSYAKTKTQGATEQFESVVLDFCKKFMCLARSAKENGSLTVIATYPQTGEEFNGKLYSLMEQTANCVIKLDETLIKRRIFPPIDVFESYTLRQELMLSDDCLLASENLRLIGTELLPTMQAVCLIANKTADIKSFAKELAKLTKI